MKMVRNGGPCEFVGCFLLRIVRHGGPNRSSFLIDRDAFRGLPAVGALIEHELLECAVRTRGRSAVIRAVRAAIEEAREVLRAGRPVAGDLQSLAGRSIQILERERASIRPVINATGVLLHTGLGRAPLAREAIDAVAAVARGYCNLELDLEDGERGRRTSGVERLIRELTGAEAATAVNNNAGATVLVLKALAAGREVIVSRGELVEIGGSFRLPEILEASGAKLREVGTTNKTRLADYERAIGPETAAILRVHRSNFEIVGFTEAPELGDLVRLAHDRGIWAIDDIGSGAIDPEKLPPQAADEPTAAGSIGAGADVVLFSGDKLLGGPQCGVIAGTQTRDRTDRVRSSDAGAAAGQDGAGRARGDIAAGARPGARGEGDSAVVDGRGASGGSFESCSQFGPRAMRSVWLSRGVCAVGFISGRRQCADQSDSVGGCGDFGAVSGWHSVGSGAGNGASGRRSAGDRAGSEGGCVARSADGPEGV